MKKKILSLLTVFALVFSVVATAAPQTTVLLDGKKLDVEPSIVNDRTLVPLRGIFEAMGAEIDWNGDAKTVTAVKGDNTVELTVGKNTAFKNKNSISLDVPATIINGRTLVPLRFVGEAMGSKVDWNGTTRTITITTYDIVLNFPADRYPEMAANIKNALTKGKSSICTIDRGGADSNRDESLKGIPTKDGYDRVEWPMAVCAEGGAGADVVYVKSSDNIGSNSWVWYQLENYPDGTRVLFVIDSNVKANPQSETPKPIESKIIKKTPMEVISKKDYNCSDFKTQAQAQAVFEAAGGLEGNDPYDLDRDGDKRVCESLK